MRYRLILGAIILAMLVAYLPQPAPAHAQACDPTPYIDTLLTDIETVQDAIVDSSSSDAANAAQDYLTIADVRREYEDLAQVPECVRLLHNLMLQWITASEDQVALVIASFADPANSAFYNQEMLNANDRLTVLASAATSEITRLQEAVAAVEQPPTRADNADWYRVYFTDVLNDDSNLNSGSFAEQALVFMIDNSQTTIDAALFELNARDATDAFVRALDRGVTVRLVVDDDHAFEDPESTITELIDAGAQVVSDRRSALMHSKFLIFDSATIWTGSTNITENGFYRNNNNAMIIRSPELVENFQAEFEEMFSDSGFSATRGNTRPVPNRVVQIGNSQVETYFSPEDGDLIERRIIELINGAQSSVLVMAFSFTLDDIGQAMVARMADGVSVAGVFETTGSNQGQMPVLACNGGQVRRDTSRGILHHKVFIIDQETVVMGSFNFSANARDRNTENVLIIQDADIARAYIDEFRLMWQDGAVPDVDC